ncbi:MAG: prolyl oligopeptidase family serine peptidase [Verrucomicrobiales bacterium]
MNHLPRSVCVWLPLLLGLGSVCGQEAPHAPVAETEIKITEGWVLPRGERSRARPSLPVDPIEWAWIQGRLAFPERDAATSPSAEGLSPWEKVSADNEGKFDGRSLDGGWLATHVDVEREGVWLLDAQGHGSVRVNGVPRVGDLYGNGRVEIPVLMRAGANTLAFTSGRGAIGARLRRPEKEMAFSLRDSTFPHVIRGESEPLWGAILVVNASDQARTGLKLLADGPGFSPTETAVPDLLPLSVRKVAFRLDPVAPDGSAWAGDTVAVALSLKEADSSRTADTTIVPWTIRNPDQTHIRTFRSRIEGAVQYYGVVPPASGSPTPDQRPGLILSLHGAGVEAEGQAAVYQPRPNAWVITPTNRRNFGFDWEDWGRWDALEVLEIARARFGTDPTRTWLTGHSMGGHGTWHIGSLFPDRFAALGPSAGWISFSTYAGRTPEQASDPVSVMLRRPLAVSDTLARIRNLQYQGVFILHGDADDNVPVDQARRMREELSQFHPDFVYKEQPGAGHWWGNVCCDYPPMMRFFEERAIRAPHDVPHVRFLTPNPAASADCFWVGVEAQQRQGELSEVDLQCATQPVRIAGTTKNVALLTLRPGQFRAADAPPVTHLAIDIDGTQIENLPVDADESVSLRRAADDWIKAGPPDPMEKNPRRGGSFKSAFQNRFLLVYGTQGTAEENTWMLERTRYDAEIFWYRGNGSVDVVSDARWRDAAADDRNVIVYGNASINAAWAELLADSPVAVAGNQWRLAERELVAESVAVLLLRPRPNSSSALVGAIGGTTLTAMRATDRLPLYTSGTGYPDVVVTSPDFLQSGASSGKLAGYFGNNWSFDTGEWAEPHRPE